MKDNSKLGSSDSLIAAVRSIMEKEHTVPKGDKEKKLAALAHPKDKITHKDVLVGRGVLKKENSGERMGTIVATRKEKVELEPKLKESNDHEKVKSSIARIHADLIKHVPVGHHYWMDAHHSEGPLSDSDHENHKQTARSDEVRIKVSQHRDEEGYHHVVIHSPHKEDVKAAADHLYDDKSVMKKGKHDDAHYAKGIKESNDHKEVKRSMEHIHADLIKHVPVGHHYWMDIHHSEGPLSHKDHEDHKQAARSDGVKIKVSQHRDHDNHHHVLIHSPHKEDVKAAADHLYDDKSVMKKGKDDDDDYAKSAARAAAKSVKEQVDEAGMSASTIKHKTNISKMSPAEFANHPHYKELSDKVLQSMAWRHGHGGPGTSGHDYYVNKRKKGMNEEVEQVGEAAKWRKGPEGKSWKSNPMSDPEDDEGEKAVYGSSKLPNVPAHKATGKITKDTYAKLGSRKSVSKLKYRGGIGFGPKSKLPEETEQVDERKLTGTETDKKEKYVMSLKKKMGGFKKRYGERAKEVMYATATKMAKSGAKKSK